MGILNPQMAVSHAMRKHDQEEFYVEVIEEHDCQADADFAESLYIQVLETHVSNGFYNVSLGGNGLGRMSDETKAKISAAMTGIKRSAETRARMSAAAKQVQKGPMGEATRAKLSVILKEIFNRPEVKMRRSLAQKGRKLSDEHKAKLSANKKAYYAKMRAEIASACPK